MLERDFETVLAKCQVEMKVPKTYRRLNQNDGAAQKTAVLQGFVTISLGWLDKGKNKA